MSDANHGGASRDEPTYRGAATALQADDALGPVVERHAPLHLDPSDDLYRRLVVSILRQQVSMASAAATRERLFGAVEVTPEGILAADRTTLEEADRWRPYRSYASLYLWRTGEDIAGSVDEVTEG